MSNTRNTARVSALAAGAVLAVACGDNGGTTGPVPDVARPTTVTLSLSSAGTGALGATFQPASEVLDHRGRVIPAVAVIWVSSRAWVAVTDQSGQLPPKTGNLTRL